MASPTSSLPKFAQALRALSEEDRAAIVKAEHADYRSHSRSWQVLLDAFEGENGFLDGSYLWPYPRESHESFVSRQAMARYHNYLEALVDIYVRYVFSGGVKRQSTNTDYMTWLEDVDGDGMGIDDFMRHSASLGLSAGHAGVLVDKTRDEPTGPTRADEQAIVVASWFPATAILDWRFERSELVAVKLRETSDVQDIAKLQDAQAVQYLLWDLEGWARYDSETVLVAGDTPALDLVPFIVLRPKRSTRSMMTGRPLVSNANVVRALFNRASEEDQVLRDQAFSVLTVNVPVGGDVEQARNAIAGVVGTTKALIAIGDIKYATPDMQVPGTIRDSESFLIQEMYRAAHVRFKRDSLESETAEAIRLQHSELNEALQGLAAALAACEYEMARAWFAWSFDTPERAQAEFERADLVIEYPDEFFVESLLAELQAWSEAIRLGLGDTMTKRIKKRAVRRIEPEMPQEDLDAIDAEIDAMVEEPSPGEKFELAQQERDTGQFPPGGEA